MSDNNQGLLSPGSKVMQFSSFVVSPITNGERSFWNPANGNCTPGGLFDSLKTPVGLFTPGGDLGGLDTPTLFNFANMPNPKTDNVNQENESDGGISTKPPSPVQLDQNFAKTEINHNHQRPAPRGVVIQETKTTYIPFNSQPPSYENSRKRAAPLPTFNMK